MQRLGSSFLPTEDVAEMWQNGSIVKKDRHIEERVEAVQL